jgi:hypothetical protein
VTEILGHWHAGRSLSLGVDRKTIRKYVPLAVAAGIAPGGPARARPSGRGLSGSGSQSWLTRGWGR